MIPYLMSCFLIKHVLYHKHDYKNNIDTSSDKVATLGEDVQKAAEEKFKAVNQAYEAICKERGI